MTRYRRRELSRGDSAAAAVTSALLGLGTAAIAFYVTRLLISREPLADPEPRRPSLPPAEDPSSEAGEPRPGV